MIKGFHLKVYSILQVCCEAVLLHYILNVYFLETDVYNAIPCQ